MWSDRYNYYNIQSDENFTQKTHIEKVVHVFLETNHFIEKSYLCFNNKEGFPWTEIMLVETSDGNFHSSQTKNNFVNLITIVCSKGKDINQKIYENTFLEIAKKLNWKLFLEEDDNGNENIEIT